MKKLIGKLVFFLMGWKIVEPFPNEVKKCVLVGAPHTSNWDYFIGVFAALSGGLNTKFLIKKEAFKPVIGPILKFFGGIPVDRSKSGNLVQEIVQLIESEEKIQILFTPEGTRKWVKKWKTGFYNTALEANVPIVLGYLDYKKKIGGYNKPFYPSGNYMEDMKEIRSYYQDKNPKYPEKFNRDFK